MSDISKSDCNEIPDGATSNDAPYNIPNGSKLLMVLNGSSFNGRYYPPVQLFAEPLSNLLNVNDEKKKNTLYFMFCRYIHDRIINDTSLWKKDKYNPSKVFYEVLHHSKEEVINMARTKDNNITYIFCVYNEKLYFMKSFGEGLKRKEDTNVYIIQIN